MIEKIKNIIIEKIYNYYYKKTEKEKSEIIKLRWQIAEMQKEFNKLKREKAENV